MTYVRQKDSVTTYLNQMLYGKRVKFHPDAELCRDNNISGMITGWDKEWNEIRVRWDDGPIDSYNPEDLILI